MVGDRVVSRLPRSLPNSADSSASARLDFGPWPSDFLAAELLAQHVNHFARSGRGPAHTTCVSQPTVTSSRTKSCVAAPTSPAERGHSRAIADRELARAPSAEVCCARPASPLIGSLVTARRRESSSEMAVYLLHHCDRSVRPRSGYVMQRHAACNIQLANVRRQSFSEKCRTPTLRAGSGRADTGC